jgi:hypothetical protein
VPGQLTVEEILAVLAETPVRIAAATKGLARDRLHAAGGPDEWSANDVLAHLRSCADVWGDYLRTIVNEDGPTIRAVNPRRWIEQTDYPGLEFAVSFRAFTRQRADLLAFLRPLPPPAWSRSARVTGAGAPLQLTVLSYADRMARHERPHVQQIERAVRFTT